MITKDQNQISPDMVDAITFLHGNDDLLKNAVTTVADNFYLPLRTPAKDAQEQLQADVHAPNVNNSAAEKILDAEVNFDWVE